MATMSVSKSLSRVAALAPPSAAATYLTAPDTFIELAIGAERLAAARYPNRMASLGLIASGSIRRGRPCVQRQKLTHTGNNELIATRPEKYEALIDTLMSTPPYPPAALKKSRAMRPTAVSTPKKRQFADLPDEALILEDTIKGVPIRAHMLWGDPGGAHAVGGVDVLLRLLPRASRTVVSGIARLPMRDATEARAKDYLAFREAVRP